MARSFLFSADDPHVQTTRLIATARQFTGFTKGETGALGPGWYGPGADNGAFLLALREALAQAYPDAGPALWAVRLWTNLLWQPAYLAVIATHLHGALPDFSTMSQARRGIYVDGFRLEPRPQHRGSALALLPQAAAALKHFADTLLSEVNALERLRPVPARRLLADRVLGLLVRLAQHQPQMTRAEIGTFEAAWLANLDLDGQGRLDWIALPDGRTVPIVRRKGCCLDYLATPDRFCANCPKLAPEQRLPRQLAEWAPR